MAVNYTYQYDNLLHVIKTPVSNIVSEVIKKPVCSTSFYGMNGGFFAGGNYTAPPVAGISISHNGVVGDPVSNNNSDSIRGTFFTYSENNSIKAGVARCKNVTDLKNKVGALSFKTIIGGGSLMLRSSDDQFNEVWDAEGFTVSKLPVTRRSALGFKKESDGYYAYLVVSGGIYSINELRNYMRNSLGCTDAIHLDGSGSAQMQCYRNGSLLQEKGSDGGAGRYIWNMVRFIILL